MKNTITPNRPKKKKLAVARSSSCGKTGQKPAKKIFFYENHVLSHDILKIKDIQKSLALN
jgi:hypothetical protein